MITMGALMVVFDIDRCIIDDDDDLIMLMGESKMMFDVDVCCV